MCVIKIAILLSIFVIAGTFGAGFRRRIEKEKCPKVNLLKSFDFQQMLGSWYVIEYYASSEESQIYRCMRTVFSLSGDDIEISMNFTYSFIDDPDNEHLYGNITWRIPDLKQPSHWVHAEDTYEGVYNTYLLDMDASGDNPWSLLLHCAEKSGSTRYLSSFVLSRKSTQSPNVISFLRDKLPRYDIDLQFMYPMDQHDCSAEHIPLFYQAIKNQLKPRVASKHPLKHPEHQ